MRQDLPDGQWYELHERITHAEDKAIKRLSAQARTDETVWFDVDSALIRTFVKDWYVKDRDGQPIPATDPDAVDRLPSDIADTLATAAALAYTGATDPKPTPAPSDA
jgi:hypothetical protein